MFNYKTATEFAKKIIISWLLLLIGYWIIVLPIVTVYYKYYHTGGDVDLVGGIILSAIEGIIFTLIAIFFDIILRCLTKLNFQYKTYFFSGIFLGLILVIVRILSLI